MTFADPLLRTQCLLRVRDYDLAATLDSGQAFRWTRQADSWTAVIGNRWVKLTQVREGLLAEAASAVADWQWLERYLQTQVDLDAILHRLPPDPFLRRAIHANRGLRLLRQDPWECLASFILSSTKQIAHIKRIVERLCERHGDRVPTPAGEHAAYAFPSPQRIASLNESSLRSFQMGFRAPYLLEAARRVTAGQLDFARLKESSLNEARSGLMALRGVGRKIADCVLLFSLGFDEAFPVDVWVMRALRSAWFPDRRVTFRELISFSEHHFGRHGGYAQQYLFHHVRTNAARTRASSRP